LARPVESVPVSRRGITLSGVRRVATHYTERHSAGRTLWANLDQVHEWAAQTCGKHSNSSSVESTTPLWSNTQNINSRTN